MIAAGARKRKVFWYIVFHGDIISSDHFLKKYVFEQSGELSLNGSIFSSLCNGYARFIALRYSVDHGQTRFSLSMAG